MSTLPPFDSEIVPHLPIPHSALDFLICPLALCDPKGNVTYVNKAFSRLWGYDPGDCPGKPLSLFCKAVKNIEIIFGTLKLEGRWCGSLQGRKKDGRLFEIGASADLISDSNGRDLFMIFSFVDDTACRQAKKNLRCSEARYHALVENQMEIVCRWLPDTTLTYVNEAFCNYHGRSKNELLGSRLVDLIPDDQQPCLADRIRQLISEKKPLGKLELRSGCTDGSVRWLRWSDTPVLDDEGQILEMQSVGTDITSLKESQEALEESKKRFRRLARYDLLTNLPNRSLLLDRLKETLTTCRYADRPLAVFFADLDRFKQINDSLGNAFGDRVLCEMVWRIKKVLGKNDILARLSSDEFVLVCPDIEGHGKLCHIAGRLLDLFRNPIVLSGHTLHLSASIGVAWFQQDEIDPETLLRQADIAMNEAKQRGGNRFQFFSKEMQTRLEETFMLEKQMREDLEYRNFFLHYQPQVDLTTGKISGVEALARWETAPGQFISPDIFIKIAENSGLIHKLGDFILEEACTQNLRWQQKGLASIQITVNISAKQFAHPDFVTKTFQILQKTGLAPQWLELEITESTIMDNLWEAIAKMKTLQEAGVRFAIDDFGTGYSSLNYLRQLPVSKLKIDRSFMVGIPGNQDNEKLVVSILALARSFNLQPVAEGIETDQQLAYLRRIGCRFGQGFLFSRPVNAEAIENLAGSLPI
jgi:diguanylate cyclase (GGDEF)-like protein/PAS domain S-box-containing protein